MVDGSCRASRSPGRRCEVHPAVGVRRHITRAVTASVRSRGEGPVGKPRFTAREVHPAVEVYRHITRAVTAILRLGSRGGGPVEKARFTVKGTARDQLLGSDIAGLQKSRQLR